jgi:Beta-galactosidase
MSQQRRRDGAALSLMLFVSLTFAAVVVLMGVGVGFREAGSAENYYFGTLVTDRSKARLEHRVGIQVAYLELRWDRYEPSRRFYDPRYIKEVKQRLQQLRAARALVELAVGLNHPPAWLLHRYPETAYVNQYQRRYTRTANLVFSQIARREAQTYISRVQRDIGLKNIWAIRVGVDANGEFIYPPAADAIHDNSYWAFDVNAQASAGDPRRPRGISRNPFPGWKPGDRTYRGKPFSVANVRRWYDWYLAALADAVNWQIRSYRSLGYRGYVKVLVPGTGYFPSSYDSAIANYLDGTVAADLLGLGAGFFKTIPLLTARANVEIVATSLVNGSGTPRNNGCTPADGTVDVLANPPDPAIYDWSSVRWITNLARRSGFALVDGESAGTHVAPYYPGVMADAAHQMVTCGLQGLMWAFDGNLYDGTPGSSLQDYAAVIRRYNR